MKKTNKAQGKSKLPPSVEFYDNIEIIEHMLARRFPMRRIWQTLQEENKYSGDYTHFCRLVKKEKGNGNEKSKEYKKPTNIENEATDLNSQKEELDDENEGPLWLIEDLPRPKRRE